MDVERAVADLAEVRLRLALAQRFDGLSSTAAALSGAAAIITGLLQCRLIPAPLGMAQANLYLDLWLACLFFALAINYGAILLWIVQERRRGTRGKVGSIGFTILPAIVSGGILTTSFTLHGFFWMLPGAWCLCYALGLFASKALLPRGISAVAAGFLAFGALLFAVPGDGRTLEWWIMPLAFGIGQFVIAFLILRDSMRSARSR